MLPPLERGVLQEPMVAKGDMPSLVLSQNVDWTVPRWLRHAFANEIVMVVKMKDVITGRALLTLVDQNATPIHSFLQLLFFRITEKP